MTNTKRQFTVEPFVGSPGTRYLTVKARLSVTKDCWVINTPATNLDTRDAVSLARMILHAVRLADLRGTRDEKHTVSVNVWCGCWTMPPDLWGGGGEECGYGESIVVDKAQWDEESCSLDCPACGAKLWQGESMELTAKEDL